MILSFCLAMESWNPTPITAPWGEVGAFYWTVSAPDIVNPGREEQDLVSV